jgi:hypothetical protein
MGGARLASLTVRLLVPQASGRALGAVPIASAVDADSESAQMSITVDSYLVHAGKGLAKPPEISGTRVSSGGKLHSMLSDVFDLAEKECKIDIAFNSTNGAQDNECRDALLTYFRKPIGANGLAIARRLQEATGNRSGIGLLFLMCGKLNKQHKLVIARFPADEGVLAEAKGSALSIEFVERVFMRSAKAYKSVVYKVPSLTGTFWRGKAVDRQIDGPREISQYWIDSFLMSGLATLGAAGSRRLATAIRRAVAEAPADLRDELVAAVNLIPNGDGKKSSATQLLEKLQVSAAAIALVRKSMGRPDLMDDHFTINTEEFTKHTHYRSIKLDNGALLSAETADFETVFTTRKVAEGRLRFATEGRVIEERIRKQQ